MSVLNEEDRIRGLTVEERAAELGLEYWNMRALEIEHPWIRHWSARYENGATNMRAWLDAGCPVAERDKLCVHGERSIVRAVRAVVDGLPEPVAWHLVQTTAIACVRPRLGLTGPLPPPPPRPTTAIDIPFTDPGLIAHECAHAWHRNPLMWSGLTMAQIEAVDEAVRKLDIGAAQRDERADLHELAADRLACTLGFPVDTRNQREQRRALRRDAGEGERLVDDATDLAGADLAAAAIDTDDPDSALAASADSATHDTPNAREQEIANV